MKTGKENPKNWAPPEDAVEVAEKSWTPPEDAILSEPVKKKDITISAPESKSTSIQVGSQKSGVVSKQEQKPSEKSTKSEGTGAYYEGAEGGTGATEKILGGIFDFFLSAGKTGLSTLKHTLPQALDYLNKSENFNPPKTYEEKIAEQYSDEAAKQGISRADTRALKEFALNKKKQLIGEKGIEAEKLLHQKDINESKVQARKIFEEHNTARQKELEGTPQSYRDVNDIESGVKYTGGMVGQALASFPLILTGGASEGADAYYEGVDEKAKALSEKIGKKVSPDDVIRLGLDKDAQNHALGVQFINGALDVVGFETILGSAVKKQVAKEAGKEIVKKGILPKLTQLSKPALGEALTETAQELDTFVQSRLSAGRTKEEIAQELKTEYPRLIDSALGGFIGGGALGGGLQHTSSKQAIEQAQSKVTSTSDQQTIKEQAANIVESLKQNDQNAIHKSSTETLHGSEQTTTGGKGSERVGVGTSQQGQETTGTGEQTQGKNESNALSEQQKEETLNQNTNENETGVRGTLRQGRGENRTEGGAEQEISGSNNGESRQGEVRSGENGEVGSSGKEKAQQITTNETEQISSGSQPESTGGEPTYAKDVIGRVHEANERNPGKKATTKELRTQEETALEAAAKEQGHWIESPKEEPHAQGMEQVVYLDSEGGKVKKINSGVMHSTWKDFMDRIERHNEMFPDVAYTVKGFTKVNGEFGVVLEQPLIKGVAATDEEIKTDLEKRGFRQWGSEPLKKTTFHNEEAGITIKDVHPDNVIKDEEGNLRYIDTMNEPYDESIYGEEKEPPATPPTEQSTQQEQPENGRQFAVARRIEASDANPEIKRGIKEKGDTYIPKGLNITEKEAQDLIDHHGTDKVELMVKDPNNGLTGDTRVVLSGKLYETYAANGENIRAVDIAIWAENFLMQAGRAANAGKFWKMITSSGEDQIVLAIEREYQRNQNSVLSDIDRSKTKEQLDAKFRRLVEEKVQQTVEGRLAAAKLITKEKRKEIGDFFDSLKVNTKNNIASAALLPIGILPHVWNATVDIMKQAVLTGADVANAIQAGIDYIKANQKEPFDEQKFRDEFTPEIKKIMPKKKIKASEIDPSKIQTPKISGKKKIDFINKVVDAFNNGELTDQKFDEIYASKLGFREFTKEDRIKIRKLAKTIGESEKFDEQLRALPADQFTRENIEKMKGLREAAKQANKDLQEYSQAPADVYDTLIAIMQANLMSTMSLVSNVWYNVTYSPLRSASLGIASMLDYGMSKMAKIGLMPKAVADRSIDFAAIQKGYAQGMWNGALEGLKQIKTGTQAEDNNLREIHSKFNPGKAVSRWSDKDRTLRQKANDYIEGTIGWEAETIFRLLNLGDKPFKRAAELARAMELGAQKGLKGKELEKFIMLPDAESEATIVKSGQEATFQQTTEGGKIVQNALTQFLNFVATIPVLGGPAKVIIKSQIPFVKTPLNLIIETVQYAAPPATFATGIYQIAKGNKRAGSILVGKAIVGTMLWKVATSLFLKGLLTGDDDKDKKKRDFQLDKTPPPNSINTTAISRGLVSGDWSIHDGDTWVSYSKMGVAGICLDNYSNIYKERIANHGDISKGPENYLLDMMQSAPRVASSTIEQSFLQGTSSALEALKSGDQKTMDTWLIKTTESVGSILYPNTIATVAKASDDYLRDTTDPEFLKRLKNVYKAKLFLGEELPAKVNLWGDKVTGNPEGRSKYAYYLFDPSKFKNISTDDFRFKLYQAFKTDYDGDWLPSMPQRNISVDGQQVKLTPKEYEELCIRVGQERSALVSSYLNSTKDTDPQTFKEELKVRYQLGYDLGKEKYMIAHGMNVQYKFRKPLELQSVTKKLNKSRPKF